ncbi:unnamed protein product, partial [Brassica rapa subsp. narinosa]
MRFMYRLLEDEFPFAVVIEKQIGKREIVLQEDDWKDLEIKMISELFVANQNESEECITPFPKRKEEDADLPDISSTSKKLCTAIKVEKEKEE